MCIHIRVSRYKIILYRPREKKIANARVRRERARGVRMCVCEREAMSASECESADRREISVVTIHT